MMTSDPAQKPLLYSDIKSLEKLYSGKVRDLYVVDEHHLLIIASDRISAYDVIMPRGISGKGKLLTEIALYWFNAMADLVPNHLSDLKLEEVLPDPAERAQAAGRCMLVKRLKALPVEAVVRGYLIGSGWRDYQASGQTSGVPLPENLTLAAKLEQPIFTPSSKADAGGHDENISFAEMQQRIGSDLAQQIRDISLSIYQRATVHAYARGIIIADTKFEFGLNHDGQLTLMDEILTPDSSRFWPVDQWQPGVNPNSFDKQPLRDYLDTLDWNKQAPGPELPDAVINDTLSRYKEALRLLTHS